MTDISLIIENAKKSIPNAFLEPMISKSRIKTDNLTAVLIEIMGSITKHGILENNDVIGEIEANGTDALASYSSFHTYDEISWGITFDFKKILSTTKILTEKVYSRILDPEKSVESIWDMLSDSTKNEQYNECFRSLFNFIYFHELFHFNVDLFSLDNELFTGSPQKLTYSKEVNEKTKHSDKWNEEIFANNIAFYKEQINQERFPEENGLEYIKKFVELQPAGYRDWKKGNDDDVKELFCKQLVSGNIAPSRFPDLPSFSLKKGNYKIEGVNSLVVMLFYSNSYYNQFHLDVPIFMEQNLSSIK